MQHNSQRFAVGIEFCGSAYRGWQTQQLGVRSVQQTIETALCQIANQPTALHAAGRTDAGVHASNMVAHFDTTALRSERNWLMGVNSILPKDIALKWISAVPPSFHARFSAVARRYYYVIYNHAHRPALLYGQVTHEYNRLQREPMQQALTHIIGTHDFSSFRAAACQSNQPIRTVSHAVLRQQGPLLVLDIQANGFLHHMVRNIVGSLLTIGKGDADAAWMAHLLTLKDRTQAASTAPPDGLYFVNAYYPEPFNLPQVGLGPIWLQT